MGKPTITQEEKALASSGRWWNWMILTTLVTLITPCRAEVAISQKDGVTTLWFNSSDTKTATFVIDYSTWFQTLRDNKTSQYVTVYICVTSSYWGHNCDYWGAVGWNTGNDWGYRPQEALAKIDKNQKSLLSRMIIFKTGASYQHKIILSIENPSPPDGGGYVLGIWRGTGWFSPKTLFYLRDMYNDTEYPAPPQGNSLKPHITTFNDIIAIDNPSFEDTLAIETGFSDVNLWLEWMKYNAGKHNRSNCYVCGKARPHLGTVPLHIPENQERCFLSLYTDSETNDSACEHWKREYPILSKKAPNPSSPITIYPGSYTCYVSNSTEGKNLGTFPPGYCIEKRNTTVINQTQSLGDIYWICGDMKIRTKLDSPWKGECALAKVIMPLHILPEGSEPSPPLPISPAPGSRKRRAAPQASFDPHVYIDAIGVPRGVPDEFKARDQVAAGFESLIPIITINKNVDWINYIYYNQQRFVNDTREALKGVAEQLEATSQMAIQNRMALDMILAEKGGTCVYIGKVEGCCTFIPDNTGPNGKVTLAIKKLEDLSVELKRNSGIDNSWSQYFGWFENWKQALVQIGIIILVILAAIALIVYCVIPCCKKLTKKGIESSVMYQDVESCSPADYQRYLAEHRSKEPLYKNHII